MRILLLSMLILSACAPPAKGRHTCQWADTIPYSFDGVTEQKSELFVCAQPHGKSGRLCEVIKATSGDPALVTSNCSQ